MAVLTPPLSASEVQKAKPGATEYELFNGQGLILSVRSSGNIIWCFRYKRSGSASGATITLRYFPAMSPASAWILHAEHPALLFKSIDPKNWNRKK
ncbi:hypothetical protein QF91_003428 [Salmonella enterica subsp. salamae]|nr:hypothetical protein [Salmonella enterica subsp. salamae]EDH0696447.1 hypothetical protein [Salmonella enterica]EHM1753067.1 hypothetical protein [Salmonella enterica subsp. salamae serovar 40:c:e,n,x,z15]ECI4078926.1 hypothetical protein [Salmonella enterica subsp. salamae]EDV0904218.1 hypothetical protein [Salmonella enterica subsp. salamae]